MLTQKRIEQLSKMGNKDYFMTTLYLNVAQSRNGEFKIVLKDMLKERRLGLEHMKIQKQISREQSQSLEQDFIKIENFLLRDYVHRDSSKGIAIFSCSAYQFWEFIDLPQSVPNHLNADYDPYIRTLGELLSDHRHYAVALIDQAKAKIIDVNLGVIKEHGFFENLTIAKGKSSPKEGDKERHAERAQSDSMSKHFKHVALELDKLNDNSDLMWIILGGRKNYIAQFEGMLSGPIRKKMIGHVVVAPDAKLEDVLQKTDTLAKRAVLKHEKDIIDQLRGESSHGGKGIFGLQPTLHALRKGGVDTLVVTKGFCAPGFICHKCFFIGTSEEKGKRDTCPVCAGPVHDQIDIIEQAITFGYMHGCKVETPSENSRMKIMGNFGALLRY